MSGAEPRGAASELDALIARTGALVAEALGAERAPEPIPWSMASPLDDPASVAGVLEHTLLDPRATRAEVLALCDEVRRHGFVGACVNPTRAALAAEALEGSPARVVSVVGFPFGASSTAAKARETAQAIADGAEEIDVVVDRGALREGDWRRVGADLRAVVDAAAGAPVKVILETAEATAEATVAGCLLARAAGAAFVKTSTGFGAGGATAEAVRLMRRCVGAELGVKASGGIRDLARLEEMVAAGATRVGASASVRIWEEARAAARG